VLGGIGERVAAELQELTALESRATVLGHPLRGGSPTALDRMLDLAFGTAAVVPSPTDTTASWSP
jgi:6-phosphofructokinase 1